MPLFLSTFVNKIDRKGRISVPASFRSALSHLDWPGVVLYRSPLLPAIVGADLAYMERHSDEVDEIASLNDPKQALSAAILADSRQLPFDPEGRITLPVDLLEHANIVEQAAFVGRGKTFQIWEPKALEAHNNQALAMVRDSLARGQLGQPAAGAGS